MKITSLALIALMGVSLSACANTWAGVGQDTQNVGANIEQSAGSNR